jgi:sugar lactone lactonase YvrE
LDELYVTSARQELTSADMQTQPLASSLFRIKGLGARGRSADVYKG